MAANPRIAFTLAVVFLAGAATGMLGMRYGLHEQLHRPASAAASSDPVIERFRKELDLSSEQTEKLASVLADYGDYYRSVEDQIRESHLREQIEDLRSTGKNRILELLNEEQRKKFEKMTSDFAPSAPAQP